MSEPECTYTFSVTCSCVHAHCPAVGFVVIACRGVLLPVPLIGLSDCVPTAQVASYSMFVTQMAFHARISDPAIGGTYMTLLNTISNLGANWPGTVALWFLDPLTDKSCQGGKDPNLDCDTTLQFEVWTTQQYILVYT